MNEQTNKENKMVFPKEAEDDLIYNIKLSSVGPGHPKSSPDEVHNPTDLDLAMKLHYLTGLYIFANHQPVQQLTIMQIKESLFYLLDGYHQVCGRFRRSESGRPSMKCNDCGCRFVEAQSDKTVDEILQLRDSSFLHKKLVYHQPIGPELSFSPAIYIQVTKFKCGGMSVGLSWAHILGDAFSATQVLNKWAQFLSGGPPKLPTGSRSPNPNPQLPSRPPTISAKKPNNYPPSVKRVDPVGDHWVTPNNWKMDSFSFHLTSAHISHLLDSTNLPTFETLSAIIWQCVARVRDDSNTVIICKKDKNAPSYPDVSNTTQIIISAKVNFSARDADTQKLAHVLLNAAEGGDDRIQIEEAMKSENGVSDVVVYGAKLTFVNWEEADVYGFELNGKKPELGCYGIQGVGDEGVVLIIPGNTGKDRLVTLIFPEDQILKLKPELQNASLLLKSDVLR